MGDFLHRGSNALIYHLNFYTVPVGLLDVGKIFGRMDVISSDVACNVTTDNIHWILHFFNDIG
jgi:hypothetical protein